ncbi:hypothetical protein VQ056_25625 [Paenibacillus sp. JTLBN-2024]
MNRITFKGLQGTTQVEDSIYVEYRNGPTIYDLKANLVDGSQAIELKEDSPAVLTASREVLRTAKPKRISASPVMRRARIK